MIALFALAGFGIWKKQHTARLEAERAAAEAVAQRAADEARRQEARELRYANALPLAAAPAPTASAPAAPAERRVEKPAEVRAENALERFRREAETEFRLADGNGDGYLTRMEARRFPALERNFERVDKDGDGRVSLQEFIQAKREMLERKSAKP